MGALSAHHIQVTNARLISVQLASQHVHSVERKNQQGCWDRVLSHLPDSGCDAEVSNATLDTCKELRELTKGGERKKEHGKKEGKVFFKLKVGVYIVIASWLVLWALSNCRLNQSLSHSALKSFNTNHNISTAQLLHTHSHSHTHTRTRTHTHTNAGLTA